MGKPVDVAIIVVYLAAMLAFGFWAEAETKDSADFLVAGRRLGPVLYTGTMAAVVLGGASTVGGVGLGYKFGLSGMWLVVAIAVGLLLLSLVFAGRIQRLKVYTVAQMLKLRYGIDATSASGIVMVAYTLIAVGDVDDRLRDDLQRAVQHQPNPVGNHRRRDRDAVLLDRRHVVDHADRHGPIHPQDHRRLLPAAPLHLEQGGRPRRDQGAGRGHCVRPRRNRDAYDYHVLRRLQLRNADRPGHLAARVHGAVSAGREVGWHDRGDLLPAVRHRRRADRHRRICRPDVKAKDDVDALIAETILPLGISGIVLTTTVAAMMSTASARSSPRPRSRHRRGTWAWKDFGRDTKPTRTPSASARSPARRGGVGIAVIVIAALSTAS